jgi:tetratricopeptide (TPR) repeat protein
MPEEPAPRDAIMSAGLRNAGGPEVARANAPSSGRIEETSVPQLLAQAWAERRSACLRLAIGKRKRSIQIKEGAPIAVETGLAEDRFAQKLEDAGKISALDRSKVETLAAEKSCAQASIVLALKLLDAKGIYHALRDQTRSQIGEVLEWRDGEYTWDELPGEFSSSAKPFDTLALLQKELPKRWGTDRLFAALMPDSEMKGTVAPRFHMILEKLADAGPMARQVIDRIDGKMSVGRLLGECAGDPLAAATLWILVRSALLSPQEEDSAAAEGRLEFEVIVEAPDPGRAARRRSHSAEAAQAARDLEADQKVNLQADSKAAALRAEIESLLPQLADVTPYEALGLAEDASSIQIKKAYFQAAKKYHPDALARLGLDDAKDSAALVFGRISEAFETLSDADKRKAYDRGDAQPAEIDTARLTQAETSFRKGEILLRMGNFVGALEYLEPAVELWPDEPAYQQALGWALFKQPKSDPDRAQIHLMTALEQQPDDPSTLLRLGQIARSLGNEAAAKDYAERARALAV